MNEMDILPSNTLKITSLIVFFLFLGTTFNCQAGDETYLKKLLARYAQLDSYCDSGMKLTYRGDSERFERCFRKDGYYVVAIYSDNTQNRRNVRWSDGVTEHLFTGYIKNGREKTSSLWERPYWHKIKLAEYAVQAEILKFFGIDARGEKLKWLNSNLDSFKKNEALSNDEFTVLEYTKNYRNWTGTERKWISNRDFIVTRVEYYRDEKLNQSIEVTDYRINPSLTLDDLSYDPPFLTKFSPFRNLEFAIPILFSVALLGGIVSWSRKFSSGRGFRDDTFWHPDILKMWKTYFKFVAISFVVIFVLGLISLTAGGHPPAIVFIWGYGFYFGIIVAAVGFFMFGAYPAYKLTKFRLSQKSSKT